MGEAAATPPETDAAPAAAAPQPVVSFAKKQRRGNMRKRAADDTEPAQLATVPEDSGVVRKQKASRGDNPMAFSTKKPMDDKLEPFTFDSSRTIQQSTDNRATATLETETAFDRDARCGIASSISCLVFVLLQTWPSCKQLQDYLSTGPSRILTLFGHGCLCTGRCGSRCWHRRQQIQRRRGPRENTRASTTTQTIRRWVAACFRVSFQQAASQSAAAQQRL